MILGQGEPPDWVMDLMLAEKWHAFPWVIEEEAPLIWVERQAAYNEVQHTKPQRLV